MQITGSVNCYCTVVSYGHPICIHNNTLFVFLFSRYSEFYALHQELKATFCEVSFPPMPKKIFFGRSQTKTVAYQRMGDLHQFLQVISFINNI